MEMNNKKSWFLTDIGIFLFLCGLILWEEINNGQSYLGVAFFISIGIFTITSHMMKNKLLISRGLYWVVQNIFKPKTKINHYIWGVFFIFIGFAILVAEPLNSPEKDYFTEIKKSFEFWIALVLVIIFNILVGVYTAKRGNKQIQSRSSEKSQ